LEIFNLFQPILHDFQDRPEYCPTRQRTRGGHMPRKGFERDWLRRHTLLLPMVVLASTFTSAASATAGTAADGTTVFVSTVQQLYDAVNDETNAGATVVLAPGLYVLSAKDATGASRPNGGRLELQADMSLFGVGGDRAAVVIDANQRDQFGKRLLEAPSFAFKAGFRTGIIKTGRGNNTIEWLTIAGNPLAAASISTDLLQPDALGGAMATSIRVAHVAARDSARGVDIRNVTADTKGRRIVAEIEDSDFSSGVEGIRFANFSGADYGEITADMRGNRSHANRNGCIFENNRSSNANIAVRSDGDLFDDNGLGCLIGGGLANPTTGSANFNTTKFDAHESRFTNNTRTVFNPETGGPLFTDKGGVVVTGGELLGASSPPYQYSASGNAVIVRLWDCEIAGNYSVEMVDGVPIEHFDFEAFGARSDVMPRSDVPAGTDNHALIQLRGTTAEVDVVAHDSEPPDPSGTDTVTVVRIPRTPHQ
jgi:hypothetical protein